MNWLEKARAVTPVIITDNGYHGTVDIGRARSSVAKALRKVKEAASPQKAGGAA